MKYTRHSPSALNLFAASPALFVLEKIMGHRQPGNAPMYRGTAVEDGVTHGLMNQSAPLAECAAVALKKYDTITALMQDKRRDEYRDTIPAMVASALEELRPYGVPSSCQGFVEWKPDGLQYPIVGYYDYKWDQHGVLNDLKTSDKMPSAIKIPHARQVAFYQPNDNYEARLTYCTPKKKVTYRLENVREHRAALHQMAIKCEAFLAQSDDPQHFINTTLPDLESFYWSGPVMRRHAFEIWGV